MPDAVPQNNGSNVTILGAPSRHGLDAVMTVDGPIDTAVFRAYVTKVLAPTLVVGDVVVMDNLSAHKMKGIRETINAKGATLLYLPSYSPDWSPIEPYRSKLKTFLRAAKARTPFAWRHRTHPKMVSVAAQDPQRRLERHFDFAAPSVQPDNVDGCQRQIGAQQHAFSPPGMIDEDESRQPAERPPNQIDATVADRHTLLAVDGAIGLHHLNLIRE